MSGNFCTFADMKREVYESQKAFAGEKKPSMLRRCVDHDYTERMMYMVTMVTEGRRPLFGNVTVCSEDPSGHEGAARMELSELGERVRMEFMQIEAHHPEARVLKLQMMPDHLHGIIFVREHMEQPLGMALRGFKQKCNQHYRRLVLGEEGTSVPSVALPTQQTGPAAQQTGALAQQTGALAHTTGPAAHTTGAAAHTTGPAAQQTGPAAHTTGTAAQRRDRRGEDRSHGMLFARGYNDKLLFREGQLQRWIDYLDDNPRRLAIRREHPDLFRMHRSTEVCGLLFTSMGNHFLLDWPVRQMVEMSREASAVVVEERLQQVLAGAQNGAVTYTAAISEGEKTIARAVRERGFPLVVLLNDGFPAEGSPHERFYKPGGVYFEACSKGKLLLLEPDASAFVNPVVMKATEDALRRKAEAKHYCYRPIPMESQRYRFVALNEIGRLLVERRNRLQN